MDDQTTPSEPVEEIEAPETPEPAPVVIEPDSAQPTGSNTANTHPFCERGIVGYLQSHPGQLAFRDSDNRASLRNRNSH